MAWSEVLGLVGPWAHPGAMRQVTGVDEVVDHIEDAARHGIKAQLRADGGVMSPTVFILLEDLEQPFMGQLSCRRFYPGPDAAAAVMTMGVLPAVMAATRLVVVWEAQDLNVALEAPVDPDGSALCVLDAPLVPPSVLRYHPRCDCAAPARAAAWRSSPSGARPTGCTARCCPARSSSCCTCGARGGN